MPPMLRAPLRLLAALLLLTLALLLGPGLWTRYVQALGGRGGELHGPRERLVGGNEPPLPHVNPASEGLDASGLEAAAAYAATQDSWALMVARHEHIVFERYWHGSRAETRIDAQDLAPILAALATGTALSHRRLGEVG